jgi:uncharacterized protein YydD (DUF2326 family)
MKLSKLYCNQPFQNIEFNLENGGLNIILADVEKKSDDTNTHNLGKSTLLDLIDFLLLKEIQKKDWLISTTNNTGQKVFKDYIFYLEILLNSGKFLTIRRSVSENTKISFKRNEKRSVGFVEYGIWDEEKIPFKKAKERLSEYLNFDFFKKKA